MENSGITFPQRKIKKSYRSVTGHFPSMKNNRSVAFESLLEKQLFLTLEFDDSVTSYMEQPRIEVKNAGKSRTYNLDCHIRYTSASKKDAIVEVKYVSELQKEKEKLERKFNRIEPAVTEMGMEFVLFTDETFSPTYTNNLDFLYRYKTQRFHDKYNSRILGSVEAPISAFNLADSLANSKTEYFQLANAIWALVAVGKLQADLQKEELTMNSLVWRNDGRH